MNITLIGMAGVGKSFVGQKLAERLNYKFIDVDEIIEEKTNKKLQEIINKEGDEKFIKIEGKTVLDLGKIKDCVISPGGSVIYSEKAMEFLKNNTTIIFLNDSFERIQKRITDKETRGIIGLKKENFEKLFEERMKLYNKYADVIIEISDFNVDSIVEEIVQHIKIFS